jgi:hypothetical protein
MQATGLYRQGDWVFVSRNGHDRLAMPRADYEAEGYLPLFADLQSEDDFNQFQLGRRAGDKDQAAPPADKSLPK